MPRTEQKGYWGVPDLSYQEHTSPPVYPDQVAPGAGPAGDTMWDSPDDLGLENEPGFNKPNPGLDSPNTVDTPFRKSRHNQQDNAGFDPDMTETHTSYGRPVREASSGILTVGTLLDMIGWISPSGEYYDVGFSGEHAYWVKSHTKLWVTSPAAKKQLKSLQSVTDEEMDEEQMGQAIIDGVVSLGWIRTTGVGFELADFSMGTLKTFLESHTTEEDFESPDKLVLDFRPSGRSKEISLARLLGVTAAVPVRTEFHTEYPEDHRSLRRPVLETSLKRKAEGQGPPAAEEAVKVAKRAVESVGPAVFESYSWKPKFNSLHLEFDGERSGSVFYQPRRNEEDDDHPDFVGGQKVFEALQKAFSTKVGGVVWTPNLRDNEKGWFTVVLSATPTIAASAVKGFADAKAWAKGLPRTANLIEVLDQIYQWSRQGLLSPKQASVLQARYPSAAKVAVVTDPELGIRAQAELYWNNGPVVKFPHRNVLLKMTARMQRTAVVFGQEKFDLLSQPYPVVTVQWKDIFFTSGEPLNADNALSPVIFYTTGVLIKNDPDGVVLLMELDQEEVAPTGSKDPGSTFQYIPRGVITKVVTHGQFNLRDFVDASVCPTEEVFVVKFTNRTSPQALALMKAGVVSNLSQREIALLASLTPAKLRTTGSLYQALDEVARLGSPWLAAQIKAQDQLAVAALRACQPVRFINSMKVADIVKELPDYFMNNDAPSGTAPNAPSLKGRVDMLRDQRTELAPWKRLERRPNNIPGKTTAALSSEQLSSMSEQKLKSGLYWWNSLLSIVTGDEKENIELNITMAQAELDRRHPAMKEAVLSWNITDSDDAKRESRPREPDRNMTEEIDQYDGPELPSDPFNGAPREGDTASADASSPMDSFNFGKSDSRAVPPDKGMNAPIQKNKPHLSQSPGYYSRGN